jgi:iron complex outermembrane receptor protein
MKNNNQFLLSTSFILLISSNPLIADSDDLFELSLGDLLNITVVSSNGIEENLIDAPAAMVILTEVDFQRRGYNNLKEIFVDLPGFDVIQTGGANNTTSYQRGYRTPTTNRTLFMIDGVVDNNLWSQEYIMAHQYPLSMIKRIEVLYGPSSVRYGANAFLGVINVITKKAKNLTANGSQTIVKAQIGSWRSKSLEFFSRSKKNDLSFDVAALLFSSDEEDLSDRWGFLSNDLYNDINIWGPILNNKNNGKAYGSYQDKSNDWGVFAHLYYQNFSIGVMSWEIDEGYGAQYAADRGQNNGNWYRSSKQLIFNHDWKNNNDIIINTELIYRQSRIWGNWAEATPDWERGMEDYSYISITNWNSANAALEVKQDFDFTYSSQFRYLAGWRLKRSDLTKAYDVPGYWGAYSSTLPSQTPGPYGFGAAVYHSSDQNYDVNLKGLKDMPDDNRVKFNDAGGYISVIYDNAAWRANLGIRYDNNEIWGSSINPRISGIYKFNNNESAIKFIYGEAFQEPPAQQLYGGWSGREANPDLKPEKANNVEVILMHKTGRWLHDVSLYRASYDNVIREDAINNGGRNISGLEYRGRFEFPHFIDSKNNITGNLYYTYTHAKTDRIYSHSKEIWLDENVTLGDISPHKVNLLVDIPVSQQWNFNMKANYLDRTQLYSRNPLNLQNIEVGSRIIFDSTLSYSNNNWLVSFKALNIFDRKILAPGIQKADSGNDFSKRSLGFSNSLSAQPGRSIWLTVSYKI